MPTYYFDVNGQGIPQSAEGETLADDDAAWHEATLVAGEIFKDLDGKFKPGREWTLEVADDQRQPLYLIRITGQSLKAGRRS